MQGPVADDDAKLADDGAHLLVLTKTRPKTMPPSGCWSTSR